jgi:UDP-2-acetamido-2,6-beta-L-arabino-hexul-4-ose reductase
MKILVTGAEGFIGKNLIVRLRELDTYTVVPFVRNESDEYLKEKLQTADVVIHLAGENRPLLKDGFEQGNFQLTNRLCSYLSDIDKKIPLLMTSSTQASLDNPYGASKLAAEKCVENLSARFGNPALIYRLPGVFGKWCKPNYNSVVATFCNNIASGVPIDMRDPECLLNLVYIDDVVSAILDVLGHKFSHGVSRDVISPEYSITLGQLANTLVGFKQSRDTLVTDRVGSGLVRALYATYISYLATDSFSYPLTGHVDDRGMFVEMLKTQDSGQFSFFTAHPGITRGGHYHHTKSEKFLVVKGNAEFRFRHIISGETYSTQTSDLDASVVETIPGWTHDITNIGNELMIVMLWANEVFDRENPDTIASQV